MQPVPVGACVFSTTVLLNLLWPMQDPAKAEQKRQVSTDFGTYDAAVQSCNLNDNGVRQPCSRVRYNAVRRTADSFHRWESNREQASGSRSSPASWPVQAALLPPGPVPTNPWAMVSRRDQRLHHTLQCAWSQAIAGPCPCVEHVNSTNPSSAESRGEGDQLSAQARF